MKSAFIFPGQGSQSLKMMDGLLQEDTVQEVFAIAKDVLQVDFLALLQLDDPSQINQTVNTQPLLLTASYATYLTYLKHGGTEPKIMAGHSLGEWSALTASGVIDFADALRLVHLRAKAMQDAAPDGIGAMAAVLGLDDDKVVSVCEVVAKNSGKVVAGVNFNSPGQVVIAGHKEAVAAACIALKEAGAKLVKELPVSVPSHCSLMQSAADTLKEALANVVFKAAKIPVIHNYNVAVASNEEQIREALVKQLYMPVYWTNTIKKIVADGFNQIIECGPGKVLSGLNKRIDASITSYNLHNLEDINKLVS